MDEERKLAYIVRIDEVKEIPGYDRVEYARNRGWWCIVRKDQFKVGDLAIYFEIDSLVPATKPFEFLESKKFKIKTQKMCGVYSQGLLMSPIDFGWGSSNEYVTTTDGKQLKVGDDCTKILGVKYYIPEDNIRKSQKIDPNLKFKSMAQRHAKLFKTPVFKWLMRRKWGKKLLFVFFGKKKDKPLQFPTKFQYIHKSDETRVEGIWLSLEGNKEKWIQTTKIDGSSATYIMERKPFARMKYYVCSRNIRLLKPDQNCYHDRNYYWEASDKYCVRDFLEECLKNNPKWDYVCLQGEIAGPNIQGNPHKFKDLRLFGFNFIDSENGRWNSVEAAKFCRKHSPIEWVPIIRDDYVIPDTLEELKLQADGECEAPGASGLREGFVYRSQDGQRSFKNVSRKYLMKHE